MLILLDNVLIFTSVGCGRDVSVGVFGTVGGGGLPRGGGGIVAGQVGSAAFSRRTDAAICTINPGGQPRVEKATANHAKSTIRAFCLAKM